MQELIMLGTVILLIYLIKKYKKGVVQELIIAALISLVWVTSSGIYDYQNGNVVWFGINMFPFLAWTTGLVVLREMYERIKGKHRLLKITLLYIVALFMLEYIGYHFLGIQLIGDYQGLWGSDIMHTTTFAQAYYLIIGPIYLKITDYVGVK